jgi:hypothetical protein
MYVMFNYIALLKMIIDNLRIMNLYYTIQYYIIILIKI